MTPRPHARNRTPFEAHLRTLMSRKGITTYKELATVAGVDESTIQRICSGVTKPNVETLKKLANVFGVTVDSLL